MALKKINPAYGNSASIPKRAAPDSFLLNNNKIEKPCNSYVISRNGNGDILSTYGDDTWDLRPYRLAGESGAAKIHLHKIHSSKRDEIRWLIFLVMYTANNGRSSGLSVSSIMNYIKLLRNLATYSVLQKIEIRNIFSIENEAKKYLQFLSTRNLISCFSSLTCHLLEAGEKITGYQVLKDAISSLIDKKLSSIKPDEQHPVIPPRILSELIGELNVFIGNIYLNLPNIDSFLRAITNCDNFARCESLHSLRKIPKSSRPPSFNQAAKQYGLDKLFQRYYVNNLPSFSRFICRIQHACKIYFHIYSGMRNSEMLSLKAGALTEIKTSAGSTFRFEGETSKLIGQRKKASWVTSREVVDPYQIANTIAIRIGKHAGIKVKKIPLFISAGYLGLSAGKIMDIENIKVNLSSIKSQECYDHLDCGKFFIEEEDFNFLHKIDPFRAWSESSEFNLGKIWRFTTHQLRRSLAYYISQSALVSLPTLKKQLKHLNREMTVYYCQSNSTSDDFSESGHIFKLLQDTKPDADVVAYLDQVVSTNDSLYGCHGKFIEKNITPKDVAIYSQLNRNDLKKQFLNGEISYKETALGACTALGPCVKRAMREISGCLNCERAVIKPQKIENTINYQKAFVKDLEALDPESLEYRTELAELKALIAYKVKFIDKDRTHDSN